MAYDILIRGGLLLDGSGAGGKPADLAIRVGRIAAIGADLAGDATKVIDAEGLAVAPGFIDIKTHSDLRVQGKLGFVRGGETMLYARPHRAKVLHINTVLTRTRFEKSCRNML
jgi:dihydroorotase-like cyclic amidohydrolase